MKITAIIVAAGRGTRMGADKNKVFLSLGNRTVLEYTLSTVAACTAIDDIVLVTRECDIEKCRRIIKYIKKPVRILKGGNTRQRSVLCGLTAAKDSDIVVIHDGARALVSEEIINATIENAKKYGAAAAGVPCKDSLKSADSDSFITATLDRASTYLIQTPQTFRCRDILHAHIEAERDGFSATDDCALYEKYIGRVKITPGSYDNIKLTTPDDMIIAKNILKNSGVLGILNIRRQFSNSIKILFQNRLVKRDIMKKSRGTKV